MKDDVELDRPPWEVQPKGMTLRDWFAGRAINLFPLTAPEINRLISGDGYPDHDLVSKFCYDLADAMLKAREQK